MNEARCKYCGREIVFVKRADTHESIALEKIYGYTIDISAIGSTANPVEPADGEQLYAAHSRICSKRETQ